MRFRQRAVFSVLRSELAGLLVWTWSVVSQSVSEWRCALA